MPKNTDKCSIIAKFNRYKDREQILRGAFENLDKRSAYAVQQYYTDRVKTARLELGKHMVAARNEGKYSSIRHDKLIIDNNVFRYDSENDRPVLVRNNDIAYTRPTRHLPEIDDNPLAGNWEFPNSNEAAGSIR